MLRRILQYIKNNELLRKEDRVVVGFSGGADSVALLDVLLRGGWTCVVAHCNFHLRGQESLRDEAFVRHHIEERLSVLKANGQPHRLTLFVRDFATNESAAKHHRSVEMEARELRYRWFAELAKGAHCAAVAVGHHQNDQAETVILNLLRGTGIRGLQGMRAKNQIKGTDVPVVRPLLCTTHDYILHYLRDIRHLDWVEDSTNNDDTYKRNQIRHHLQQCSKAEIEHIAQTAEWIQGYVDVLEKRDSPLSRQIIQYEHSYEKIWADRLSH